MNPANRDRLEQFLRDKAGQLFADYGLDVDEGAGDGPPLDGHTLVGVIGLVGESINATLAIAAGHAVLDATRAGAAAAPREDWIGELANQLMGRFKNELLRCGIATSTGTPMTVAGAWLDVRDGDGLSWFRLGSARGPILVWLKAEELEPFNLVEESTDCLGEGDLWLF